MLCKVINSNKYALEDDINKWLKTSKYEIKTVCQTESGENGYITVTIFYYDLAEIRKRKIDEINKNINS